MSTNISAARSTAARHMRAAGYTGTQARLARDYAVANGATGARELYVLAMSHVLYSADGIADGARFSVEDGCGPRG